ncbi:MAG TPA: TonB-dependent receptor [Novosphingobium sp.]|nr:TonB-dependent receptor [Novosphingobium sp.]
MSAHAQTAAPQAPQQLEADIVVTAEKVERRAQDTPITISAVTGEAILREARTKLDDVLANAPGVNVQGVSRGFMVSIRGLGLNLPAQNGAGAVATNYDGVYNSRGEAASTGFYDLERVESLSGPQSTIYGRNAVGGVVNIISHNPTFDRISGYAQGELGNYSNRRIEGALNLPITSNLALRVAAAGVSRDGYISNGHDDNKASSFRAKLLYKPVEPVSILLGYEQTTLGGKGPGAIPDASYETGSRTTTDPSEGYQHHIARKYWAELKADIGPGQLVVQPSYQTLHGFVQGAFGGVFANNWDPLYTDQLAIEARYSSQKGAKVPWNIGYYHYHNKGTGPTTVSGACYVYSAAGGAGYNTVYIPAAGYSNAAASNGTGCSTTTYQSDYGVDMRTTNVNSAFGQFTVPLIASLRLTLGARESWVQSGGTSDLNSGNTLGATGTALTTSDYVALAEISKKFFDYRISLEGRIAPRSLVYATVASGHREGGYSFVTGATATTAGVAPKAYDPESMVDYEIGIKNTLLHGALLLNADAFYYDYKSYQLVYFNPAVGITTPQFLTFPGREYGAEASAAFAITRVDNLTLSIVYLNSKLLGSSAYAGSPFTNAPKWSYKASYGHRFELGDYGTLSARADFRALSSQLVYPTFTADIAGSDTVMGAYATGDFLLSWESANRRYGISAYVKNVNDKLIKSSEFFGYAQVQAPRTYGVTAKVSF